MLTASLSCPTLCSPTDCSPPGSLSMEFARQESWSGLPRPPPGHLPHPGVRPASLTSPAPAGKLLATSATWDATSATWDAPAALALRARSSKAVSELGNKCMLIQTYINIYIYVSLYLLKLLSSSNSKSSKSSPKDLSLFSSFTYSYAIL